MGLSYDGRPMLRLHLPKDPVCLDLDNKKLREALVSGQALRNAPGFDETPPALHRALGHKWVEKSRFLIDPISFNVANEAASAGFVTSSRPQAGRRPKSQTAGLLPTIEVMMAEAATPEFKDHFSAAATQYALFRPAYPIQLAAYLASLPAHTDVAWDSGCGSGQLSIHLAVHFQGVEATDASDKQIAGAESRARVTYRCARAEASGLPDACVDLAVSAQAAHWYDLDTYYREVRRVCRAGAAVALVSYGRGILDTDIGPVFDHFYGNVAGPYWTPERLIVQDGYRSLAFPFREVTAPAIDMHSDWNLASLLGYVDTWSAMRGLEKAHGREPYETFCRDMAAAWGDPARQRRVTWPLSMRVGFV